MGAATFLGDDPQNRDTPVVSVVIPHFNDLANLDRCLDLLRRQTFAERSFEIIVADNGSDAGLTAVGTVARDRALVISAEIKGAGPARNAGVAASRGAILAFIDSDCRPDADWLEEGLAALADFDVVGGAVRVDVDDPASMSPTEAFEVVFAFRNASYIEAKGFTVTASMFVRRTAFDVVGPFRSGVSEDVDWCHRAIKHGFRLGYAEKSITGHPGRRTWHDLRRKSMRQISESYELYRERPFGLVRWLARSWLILLSIVPHLAYILMTRKLHKVSDRLNAAGVLVRIRLLRFIEANRLALTRRRPDRAAS